MMKPALYYAIVVMGMEPRDCPSEDEMDNYKLEKVLEKMIDEGKDLLVCKRCDRDYIADDWEITQENDNSISTEGFVCIDCRPHKGYKKELGSSILKSDVTVAPKIEKERVAPTLAAENISGVAKLMKRGS